MRERNAEWHEDYTLPALMRFLSLTRGFTAPITSTGLPKRKSLGAITLGAG